MASRSLLNVETVDVLKELDQGSGFFSDLVDEYSRQSHDLLTQIADAIEDQNWEQVRFSVHTFKGSSYNMGADQVGALCEQIESAHRQQNYPELMRLFPELQARYHAASAALHSMV